MLTSFMTVPLGKDIKVKPITDCDFEIRNVFSGRYKKESDTNWDPKKRTIEGVPSLGDKEFSV